MQLYDNEKILCNLDLNYLPYLLLIPFYYIPIFDVIFLWTAVTVCVRLSFIGKWYIPPEKCHYEK